MDIIQKKEAESSDDYDSDDDSGPEYSDEYEYDSNE